MGVNEVKKKGARVVTEGSRPAAFFSFFQKTLTKPNASSPHHGSPFSHASSQRATKTPTAGVAAASPTAGETCRRRCHPPPEASPARIQLPESFPFSFFSRARDRPDPGAPPSYTMPLQPRSRHYERRKPSILSFYLARSTPALGAAVMRLLLKNRHTRGHCAAFLPSETSPATPTSTRDVDIEKQECSTFAPFLLRRGSSGLHRSVQDLRRQHWSPP